MKCVKSLAVSAVLAATLTFPVTAAFAAGDMSSSSSQAPAGYSDQTNQQFVESCVKAGSGDSRAFCQCLIQQLRTDVPYQRFSEMDREYQSGKVTDQTRSRMAQAAKACTS